MLWFSMSCLVIVRSCSGSYVVSSSSIMARFPPVLCLSCFVLCGLGLLGDVAVLKCEFVCCGVVGFVSCS